MNMHFVAPITEAALDLNPASVADVSERFRAAWVHEREGFRRIDGDTSDESSALGEALVASTTQVVDEIEALPGTSMTALGLKALAYLWCGHGDDTATPGATDQRLVLSIFRDVETLPQVGSAAEERDPIFPAIHAHRLALGHRMGALGVYETMSSADPGYREAGQLEQKTLDAEGHAWWSLLHVMPTSRIGLEVYAEHLRSVATELDEDTADNAPFKQAFVALHSAIMSMATMPLTAVTEGQ